MLLLSVKKNGEFKQLPNDHLSGHGCPICKNSLGEMKIWNYLTEKNIKFESQKKFDGCKNKRLLPFDFYLPEYNICIEYDGIQHYKAIDIFGGEKEFQKRKNLDKIKSEFCNSNNIKLIRIKYNEDLEKEFKKYENL
jgi:very-short-patch-repair endonuclease